MIEPWFGWLPARYKKSRYTSFRPNTTDKGHIRQTRDKLDRQGTNQTDKGDILDRQGGHIRYIKGVDWTDNRHIRKLKYL